MAQDNTLVNRVAQSGIITLDLADFFPKEEIVEFDISPFLFQGIVLKEKDFRAYLDNHNYTPFSGKLVAVYCSTDALIPMWAYMLVAAKLVNIAHNIYFGNKQQTEQNYLLEQINLIDPALYNNVRVVVKGCGDRIIPEAAFLAISKKLLPSVKSLMYGEPCSMVPVYKKPKV